LRSLEVRYGLEKEFVLFVGTLEPRKNVPTLIRAFSLLRRMGHPHLQLVIVGRGRFRAQKRGPEELDLENVIFTGYLNDEELWVVYRASKIFAMLSIWEGFGFPLLEAMAADVPVIASNTASIPEVVGDGGLLVDPSDSEAIALAMRRLLEDEPLRCELIAKGRRQVARFQWSATAQRTASALISVDGRR
jgi:glycosyltransferase involved in cell wall biosynthesis